MPGATALGTRVTQEKRKVMSAAKNPIESSLGKTLLKTNFSDESALSTELYKIEKMKQRHRMHTIQEKKTFLQNRNLPEPTLLVERPPSPDTLRKCYPNVGDIQPEYSQRPRFMHQLKSRVKTPSNFTTIDAFSVKTKKKTNYWNANQEGAEGLRFHGAFVPSFRLTGAEVSELQRACFAHRGFRRPLSATGEKLAGTVDPKNDPNTMKPRTRSRSRQKKPPDTDLHLDLNHDPDTVFITELYSNYHQGSTDRAIKTVSFANKFKTGNQDLLKDQQEEDEQKDVKEHPKRKKKTHRAHTKKENGLQAGNKTQNISKATQKDTVPDGKTGTRVKETLVIHHENHGLKSDSKEHVESVPVAHEESDMVICKMEPPEEEVSDMKEEIRKWIKKTYEFF